MRLSSWALALAVAATAAAGAAAQNLPLPDLPYAYDALEPVIDGETMRTHHTKHHAGYLRKLNAALGELRADPASKALVKRGIDYMLRHLDEVPESHRATVRNNGGGYVNHALFWEVMAPPIPTEGDDSDDADHDTADGPVRVPPSGSRLEAAIVRDFGSFEGMREQFSAAAAGHWASGWAWLVVDRDAGSGPPVLRVATTPNQDTPAMSAEGTVPVLCLDLWEHAYYLRYKSDRANYVYRWWRVVNWARVAELYDSATGHADNTVDGVPGRAHAGRDGDL